MAATPVYYTSILWPTGYIYPTVEHVQLLDTCRKRSTFDSGYRRHVERSVHTAATCRMSTCRQCGRANKHRSFVERSMSASVIHARGVITATSPSITHHSQWCAVQRFYGSTAVLSNTVIYAAEAKDDRTQGNSSARLKYQCKMHFFVSICKNYPEIFCLSFIRSWLGLLVKNDVCINVADIFSIFKTCWRQAVVNSKIKRCCNAYRCHYMV